MNHRIPMIVCLILPFIFSGCQNESNMEKFDQTAAYHLGAIGSFAEMVQSGVKQMALSPALPPAEMDALMDDARKIAERHGVQLYRESSLIVTDLFPAGVAEGKDVLLIYRGVTLDQYLEIKKDQEALVSADRYDGAAREAITRRFGRLLSYPPHRINELLAANTAFRTMADFGIQAGNVFLYYRDLEKATAFYTQTLGLELVADYGMATILRVAERAFLVLVDAAEGMHSAEEPKTVALALLTDQLPEWYAYLQEKDVPIKYEYKPRTGNAHDGFVAIDPEGYLLEFETFKQHPENERFVPILKQNRTLTPPAGQENTVPPGLGFYGGITWLYYKDLLGMQGFYEEVLGLELVVDQGWAKIYKVTNSSFIGLVDERRGMHSFTDQKAVNVAFFLADVDGWFNYVREKKPFELRSTEVSVGPESKYRAFVGYDPEGYFLEFDRFMEHPVNERLLRYIEDEAGSQR
jgi:catechol 2,3-dioxygenase-like lactoylglutathione lyase family enzyme